MSTIQILDRNGTMTSLSGAEIQGLRSRLSGAVLQPGDEGFDEACRIWNGLVARKPALIARCSGKEDVAAAVHFAREHWLCLAVRAGGRGVAGSAVADHGMMIDLSMMREVQVDESRRIARVAGGALLSDIDQATRQYKLAAPLGILSQTGVGGSTLHGGMGWQVRSQGLSVDSLEAVEIVTANGRIVRASAHENSDLFWAVRGGSGNFGVVTEFSFRLSPLGPQVWMAAPVYPLEKATEVMTFCRDYLADAPEDLTVVGYCRTAPHIEAVSARFYGQPVVILLGCYTGPAEEGLEVIQPLCSITEPIADLSAPMDWLEAQQYLDKEYPDGDCHDWQSVCLKCCSEEVIEALVYHTRNRPSQGSTIATWFLGSAAAERAGNATPLGSRNAPFRVNIEANWHDPAASELNIAWARAAYYDLKRFASASGDIALAGVADEATLKLRAVYGSNLSRLQEVKKAYDPDNLFRGQLNIVP